METEEDIEDIVYGIEHLRNLKQTDRDDLYSTFFKQISKPEEEIKREEPKPVVLEEKYPLYNKYCNLPYLDDIVDSTNISNDFRVRGTKFVLIYSWLTHATTFRVYHLDTNFYIPAATSIASTAIMLSTNNTTISIMQDVCKALRLFAKENGYLE